MSTMEGILLDIEMFTTPVSVLLGVVLLAIGACGILLGYLADEEADGTVSGILLVSHSSETQ